MRGWGASSLLLTPSLPITHTHHHHQQSNKQHQGHFILNTNIPKHFHNFCYLLPKLFELDIEQGKTNKSLYKETLHLRYEYHFLHFSFSLTLLYVCSKMSTLCMLGLPGPHLLQNHILLWKPKKNFCWKISRGVKEKLSLYFKVTKIKIEGARAIIFLCGPPRPNMHKAGLSLGDLKVSR